MITEERAVGTIKDLKLSPKQEAWAVNMIKKIAGNGLDRELIVDFLVQYHIKETARNSIIDDGIMIKLDNGKTCANPAVKLYESGIKRLKALRKELDIPFGISLFEGC